ncbi:hypothetical protein GCM10025760_30870 [Microbacterium yannicii]|uniref:Prepilin-type N-terminal cleavage/methylation domain-containing protein n=1 Tax=Microbacterium yannicii TaxID=671622 RepID=A0ABP9MM43_9MICO|nr:prepilin-type N-terminal cleavage/methylation domain-containing protein [Microbacterium yannicii]MCO5951566.1 prepilin-type N-terminal cleavage/methylation domain-containing protein [Microbacterium yannicii]
MRSFTEIYRDAEIARRRTDEGESGFSLIELIVVVVILGILVAIAIPVFIGLQQQAGRNAALAAAANGATQVASQIAAGTDPVAPEDNDEFTYAIVGAVATVDQVCVSATSASFTALAGPGCTNPGIVGE